MGLIRNWRRRRILQRKPVPQALWDAVTAELPVLTGLDTGEMARLRDLATLFLHEKAFDTAHGVELNDFMRLTIAALACLPILNLGLGWYRGWSVVMVYPAEFIPEREVEDEAGVVHVRREPLSGEAWDQGGVILSWEDVDDSGWCDGYNVVIHELAHKLDMLGGGSDGFPPLHAGMSPEAWSSAFQAVYDDLGRRADAGEKTAIDPYAAEDPAECFAVLSEYFFEQPGLLKDSYPDVYEQLALFYRQDPAQRNPV